MKEAEIHSYRAGSQASSETYPGPQQHRHKHKHKSALTSAYDAVRAESLRHAKTCSLAGYRLLADAIRHYDYTNELSQIQGVKCLGAGGQEDGAISLQVLEDAADRIPGAKYLELEGVGHLPPMQKADEFNALMLDFLGRP